MKTKPVAAGKSSFELVDQNKLFEHLHLTPDTVFLDLACGVGLYSMEAAKRITGKGEVHAVDLWADGLDILNETIREHHFSNIHTVIADITKPLSLPGSCYDVCLLATVLHDLAIEERHITIQEVYRLLKPGGTMAVLEFKKVDHGPGPPVHIRLSEQELTKQIVPHGFSCGGCEEIGESIYACFFRKEREDSLS